MSGRAKWLVGAVSIITALSLPAAAVAVFPGENGQIAFVSGRDGGDGSADVYLLEQAGDLTPDKLTTGTGQHRHPAWSPDLTKLAYARWDGGNQKIFIGGLGEGNPSNRVGPHDSTVRDDRPAWNPAGTRIAYESEVAETAGNPTPPNNPTQMDIMIATVEEDGSALSAVNLTSTPTVTEGKPAWSPDGKWIYYSRRANASPDDDIVRERADGSSPAPEIIVNSTTAEYQPAISPDGTQICYTRGPFGAATADVYVAEIPPFGMVSGERDIADSAIGAYNCEWSPEGDQVAFVEGTFGAGSLMSESPDDADNTANATELTDNVDAVFDGNPNWAPKKPAFCNDRPATIAGTDAGEKLRGTTGRDVIQGHGGPDTIIGRGGKDIICGGPKKDVLKGGKDNDKLFGNGGRDQLNGGKGRDKCDGGGGKDKAKACEKVT